MKRNEIIELEIESYAFEGKGISKIEREDKSKKYVIFVNGSYPGDKVKARLKKVKKSFAEANAEKIISPSKDRVKAECKFFGTCGGCKQQDLDYPIQLKYKEAQVKDILERIGGFSDFKFDPIIGSDKIFFYRNKMEFSFADKRWLTKKEIAQDTEIKDRDFALGLHIPRIFDKVLDIDECLLQSPQSNDILNFTRDFFKKKNTSIWQTKTHEGFLRNLIIKSAHHTNDLMVNLVTHDDKPELFTEYTKSLIDAVPQITTVINNISKKKSQIAFGDYEKVYHGDGFIFDFIGDYKFRVSANSFFQTNTLQAEKLYSKALEFAELNTNDVVYDLYSGAGTISIFVSNHCKEVYAIESVKDAVKDAEVNKKLNEINNVNFIEADLNKSFRYIIRDRKIPKPDVIIADPPRSGMNPKTINDITGLSPQKVIYVSCNPSTQSRDMKALYEGGYKLMRSQPVDMFPHTYHIENVALLVKD